MNKILLLVVLLGCSLMVTGCLDKKISEAMKEAGFGGGIEDELAAQNKPQRKSLFANTKIDMKLQYQNNESQIFNSTLYFELDEDGDIMGQWETLLGKELIIGMNYGMTAEQYEQCFIRAKGIDKVGSTAYTKEVDTCLLDNKYSSRTKNVFTLHALVSNCVFVGELSKESDGIKISHLNTAEGEEMGGTVCHADISDVYTYQGSDIFYWINGVGGKVAETKNIFAKWAETSTP